MSYGYVDPETKLYVKCAGGNPLFDLVEATTTNNGIMSSTHVKMLEASYTTADVAKEDDIRKIFKKG